MVATIDLSGLDGSNGFRLDGSMPDSTSGISVNNIGDINGDGFDDVVVGAGGHINPNTGFIGSEYVVFGKASGFNTAIDLSSLDGSNGFRVDGITTYDRSDVSIDSAGDINGDSVEDMLVHVLGFDLPGDRSGFNYVVFGRTTDFGATLDLASLDGNNGFRVQGEPSPIIRMDSAGDINGDGFEDVIVGASRVDPNGLLSSSSHVVFGRASGFDATLDLSSLDGQNGFVLSGAVSGTDPFYSMSSAGDVNGDGLADVIVGAPKVEPHGNDSGSSYVVFGKVLGFDAALDLSSLDGSNGFRLDGVAEGDLSGSVVTSVSDINGDGLGDVIVDAPGANEIYYQGTYLALGTRYVVFGRASGFDAALDLSSLDGSNGFRLDGASTSRSSVSSAGDINGDGFDDMLIETREFSRYANWDTAYVVFGKASGFSPAENVYERDGNNGFHLQAGEPNFFSYQNPNMTIDVAGDVNGDGFDDLIVGVVEPSAEANDSGSSYVVFGKASGFPSTLDVFNSNNNGIVRLMGEAPGDYAGSSVSGAGDMNGDGFDDVIIGAPGADPNGEGTGSSYVVFGSRDFGGGQLPVIPGTPGDDVLRGTSAAEIFEAGDSNDLLIGHGGADVFHGGAGVDQIKVPDLNFESIDGGTGNDILHLDGKDLNLDLASFGGKIHGIETICLYGRGDNMLALTAESVLNLSDTSNTLKLHGNAGDRVIVQDDGWVDDGVHGFYHIYTNDDAVLLVGANLMVEFI